MSNWQRLSKVPVEHLKTIGFGNLKGKSDISPQWRIKAMSEVYGECGIGWYHECIEENFQTCCNGEVLVFSTVNVYTKTDEGWSKPVQGKGGNKIITKNKNGLIPNDEGCKMAYTDALGTALKCLGVASEIYEGNFDGSKYFRADIPATPAPKVMMTPEHCKEITDLIISADDEELMDKVLTTAKVTDFDKLEDARFNDLFVWVEGLIKG